MRMRGACVLRALVPRMVFAVLLLMALFLLLVLVFMALFALGFAYDYDYFRIAACRKDSPDDTFPRAGDV